MSNYPNTMNLNNLQLLLATTRPTLSEYYTSSPTQMSEKLLLSKFSAAKALTKDQDVSFSPCMVT